MEKQHAKINKQQILDSINYIKKIFPFDNYGEYPSDTDIKDRKDKGDALNTIKKDYINPQQNSHYNIASNVISIKNTNSTILDFGCGPLDKVGVLKNLGYDCYGIDDYNDPWHLKDDNQKKIYDFAKKLNIPLYTSISELKNENKDLKFDIILLNDVIEHLHDSPRFLLNELNKLLKEDGCVLFTVPNALNLKKRIKVIFGLTNYVSYESLFFHESDNFRGHVREYSKGCLKKMSDYMNYDIIKLKGCHQMLETIPSYLLTPWKILTFFFPNFCDSYILIVKKKT